MDGAVTDSFVWVAVFVFFLLVLGLVLDGFR